MIKIAIMETRIIRDLIDAMKIFKEENTKLKERFNHIENEVRNLRKGLNNIVHDVDIIRKDIKRCNNPDYISDKSEQEDIYEPVDSDEDFFSQLQKKAV